MADDLSSAKQTHHAQLAGEHERLAEFHKQHSGGQSSPDTGNVGSQVGGFVSTLSEHKFWIIGGIVVVVVVLFVVVPAVQGSGNNTANSNAAPNLANGGFLPSDISSALDNINQSINGIATQLGQGGNTTGGQGTNPPTTTHTCAPGMAWDGTKCIPILQPRKPIVTPPPPIGFPIPSSSNFVTVAKWTPENTPWNSTLSGISQRTGISLKRIESLNPNITNPNVVQVGQKVRLH